MIELSRADFTVLTQADDELHLVLRLYAAKKSIYDVADIIKVLAEKYGYTEKEEEAENA